MLPGGPGDTAKAKRETVVTEGRGGMLSVAGGKWTTFRHIGRTVMKKLEALPGHPLGERHGADIRAAQDVPLPGVANPHAVAHRLLVDGGAPARAWPRTPRATWRRTTVRSPSTSRGWPTRTRRSASAIHPDAPEIWAQVVYARDHEWAQTADDVLRRRTTLTIRGLDTEEVRARVQELLDRRAA